MEEGYRLTRNQKELLKLKLTNENNSFKKYIKAIILSHIIIEKGIGNGKKDYLLEKDLINLLIEYLLNTNSDNDGEEINKYNVGKYYALLAKQFNKIAIKRKISRNNLWNRVKKNILFESGNKTELRLYKYIFRGEIIPSPQYVYKSLKEKEDLPSYISLIYLDEEISPELKEAYYKLKIV